MSVVSSPRLLFRTVALVEAVTWTVLLVGMWLKYVSGTTEAVVSVGGMLHGIAFVAYVVVTLAVATDARWSVRRSLLVLLASVPPLVTVPVDAWLESRDALPGRWRLARDVPQGRRERALATLVRHPVAGLAAGVVVVAALTGLALLVGPPVGG